jgi:hypothetical protein
LEQCEANSQSWVILIGFVMEAISDNKSKVKLLADTADSVRKLGDIGASEQTTTQIDEISTIELVKSFM